MAAFDLNIMKLYMHTKTKFLGQGIRNDSPDSTVRHRRWRTQLKVSQRCIFEW